MGGIEGAFELCTRYPGYVMTLRCIAGVVVFFVYIFTLIWVHETISEPMDEK